MIEPFRIDPNLPVGAYQTYSIRQPADTTVVAACEHVGCTAWARGWESAVDESTELGRQQAAYIRQRSGRTFREQRTAAGLTVFRFDSGQRCFAEHRTRPQLFAVRDGDWRGNPTGRVRQHQRPEDWTEDFGEHQQAIADQRERG
jgi:hypothetical protein